MAKTLQFRRDTTANLASVTGSVGEIFIDTTKKTVVVMDGTTSGGFPLELQGAGTGATGITGASGSIGVNGATGITGASGSIGVNGATGSAGTNGATGSPGTNGATGITGASGTIGVNGATGSQGVQGASGSTGLTGATGSQGITGASGATGAKGDQGNFGGAAFDYLYDSSSTADSDPTSGKVKFDNTALNSATFLYINETDYLADVATSFLETIDDSTSGIKGHFSMAKKTDDTKYTLFAITGAHTKSGSYYKVPVGYLSGDTTHTDEEEVILTFQRTGDKGDTGLTGATGSAGVNGATGTSGTNGATGVQGASGSAGVQGATGSAGANGATGSAGANGATGVQGATGVGVNGATGPSGGGASVTDDTSTNASWYPLLSNVSTGTPAATYISSTKLYFNPSTGTINATIFNSLSDIQFKENVSTVSNAVDIIKQLNGVSFTWKDNGNKSYGVIAQEIETILPELINHSEGKKSVNYNGIMAFLIQAIKEQQEQINELKAK